MTATLGQQLQHCTSHAQLQLMAHYLFFIATLFTLRSSLEAMAFRGEAGLWNGDVWKAVLQVRADPKLDTVTGDFDEGCGVIRRRPNGDPLPVDNYFNFTFQDLHDNRARFLRLRTMEEILEWVD